MIRVTVWNEYFHERKEEKVAEIYPKGIHECIADFLKDNGFKVRTATLDDEECGLTQEVLDDTDVLIWWGHKLHDMVPDSIARRVADEVLKGMGLIVLHSGHHSKPFKMLMGTSCNLGWRMNGDFEYVWTVNPAHPISDGIGKYFKLEHEEVYSEPFGIPNPDDVLFISSYQGGEVFRSGCTFHRENGKIFYFQPGHEEYPIYYQGEVQKIIVNAVRWATPNYRTQRLLCPQIKKI